MYSLKLTIFFCLFLNMAASFSNAETIKLFPGEHKVIKSNGTVRTVSKFYVLPKSSSANNSKSHDEILHDIFNNVNNNRTGYVKKTYKFVFGKRKPSIQDGGNQNDKVIDLTRKFANVDNRENSTHVYENNRNGKENVRRQNENDKKSTVTDYTILDSQNITDISEEEKSVEDKQNTYFENLFLRANDETSDNNIQRNTNISRKADKEYTDEIKFSKENYTDSGLVMKFNNIKHNTTNNDPNVDENDNLKVIPLKEIKRKDEELPINVNDSNIRNTNEDILRMGTASSIPETYGRDAASTEEKLYQNNIGEVPTNINVPGNLDESNNFDDRIINKKTTDDQIKSITNTLKFKDDDAIRDVENIVQACMSHHCNESNMGFKQNKTEYDTFVQTICEAARQNVVDFWKILTKYLGIEKGDKEDLLEIEKLYAILTVFTQLRRAIQFGFPIEKTVDEIVKLLQPPLHNTHASLSEITQSNINERDNVPTKKEPEYLSRSANDNTEAQDQISNDDIEIDDSSIQVHAINDQEPNFITRKSDDKPMSGQHKKLNDNDLEDNEDIYIKDNPNYRTGHALSRSHKKHEDVPISANINKLKRPKNNKVNDNQNIADYTTTNEVTEKQTNISKNPILPQFRYLRPHNKSVKKQLPSNIPSPDADEEFLPTSKSDDKEAEIAIPQQEEELYLRIFKERNEDKDLPNHNDIDNKPKPLENGREFLRNGKHDGNEFVRISHKPEHRFDTNPPLRDRNEWIFKKKIPEEDINHIYQNDQKYDFNNIYDSPEILIEDIKVNFVGKNEDYAKFFDKNSEFDVNFIKIEDSAIPEYFYDPEAKLRGNDYKPVDIANQYNLLKNLEYYSNNNKLAVSNENNYNNEVTELVNEIIINLKQHNVPDNVVRDIIIKSYKIIAKAQESVGKCYRG